jgi:hypothetical protein
MHVSEEAVLLASAAVEMRTEIEGLSVHM